MVFGIYKLSGYLYWLGILPILNSIYPKLIDSIKIGITTYLENPIRKRVILPRVLFVTVKRGCFFILLTLSFSSFAEARSVKSLLEIRRENVVVQQWDLSCGAAALTTLLNYQHNDFVTEKEVANSLMNRPEYIQSPGLVTLRQGFSLLDLKRYVDARGYQGVGYGKLTFEDLLKKAPIIVPVNIFGYNHFVIFRGMMGDRVLLADPAWGNRTMQAELFEDIRIDFPQIGKVGFVISRLDGVEPPNRLAPDASEFVMTR
ncbi:C39 family peptidase [Candidatus Methylobacter oryzae]|uniref:C39 family peptidase n=1 Tax=Candidatus Methylobacter oryzae TaxID=2497749 RepID=A0ABY3CGE0_9GAMM|nr:C39 family peptidase [Candidatus Methylobacter oryzae]TRX02914.1 C39 family peptidase [Candidatus Methylobacter oryzae]